MNFSSRVSLFACNFPLVSIFVVRVYHSTRATALTAAFSYCGRWTRSISIRRFLFSLVSIYFHLDSRKPIHWEFSQQAEREIEFSIWKLAEALDGENPSSIQGRRLLICCHYKNEVKILLLAGINNFRIMTSISGDVK